MSAEAPEKRSQQLETIRSLLRKQLDKCEGMTTRSHFAITQDTAVKLTPSEERAIVRHVNVAYGDIFLVDTTFATLRTGRRRVETTRINVDVTRRQRRRKSQL